MKAIFKLADGTESVRHEAEVLPRVGETVDLSARVFGQRISGEVASIRHFPVGFRDVEDPVVYVELHATLPGAKRASRHVK